MPVPPHPGAATPISTDYDVRWTSGEAKYFLPVPEIEPLVAQTEGQFLKRRKSQK
jgi:hypothetical protein